MSPTIAILCVEGRPEIQACVQDMVTQALLPTHVIVIPVSSAEDAVLATRTICFDLVISAYRIDGTEGHVFERLQQEDFPLDRFIFFTGAGEEARAVHSKTIDKGIRVDQFVQELRRMTERQLSWPMESSE